MQPQERRTALIEKLQTGPQALGKSIALIGALGSGKTEWLVNLAAVFADLGGPSSLVDADIINPYFSLRSIETKLEDKGLEVISTEGNARWSDLPLIPSRLPSLVAGPRRVFLDIGGGQRGTLALTQLRPYMEEAGYSLLVVVNAARTGTTRPEPVVDFVRSVAARTGLEPTGLISNAHIMEQTGTDIIRSGIAVAGEAAAELSLPLLFAGVGETCWPAVEEELGTEVDGVPLWPLARYVLLPWERGE
ncbi:MAG: hypothetical protein K9L28_02260 [Synergistales bacterium]|nr:hypothetical protein [Synergistales bacterium]